MNQMFSKDSSGNGGDDTSILVNLPGMAYRCRYQPDYPIEFVSEGCFELTGYTPAELIGKNKIAYADLIHPDDRQMVWQSIKTATQNDQPYIIEYRIIRKDKKPCWVWEKGCIRFAENENGIIVGIIFDITCKKKAEKAELKALEELHESEARFRMLTELAPAGIIISDKNHKTLHVNQHFTRMFGYTIVEMPSIEEWWLLAYPDPVAREKTQKKLTDLITTATKLPAEIHYESKVNCKDGSVRQIDFRVTFNGELFFLILTDITERCRLEQQLRMAHKMESVGRLAGGIAHDFNNMLGVIIGYSEMAIDKTNDDELRADINEILVAGKKASDITRQLLGFARKQLINPVVVDLNNLVDSMLAMLKKLLGENINLTWKPQNDIWQIKLDPSQLEQILVHLCLNSRDAIHSNGHIIIETANVVLDNDYCFQHQGFIPGEFVMLSVNDNGCGMSQKAVNHVFEPFFTTQETISRGGGGMGLPTVYGIAKQNNGFINVYSELNQGTGVKIYLPRISTAETSEKKREKIMVTGNGEAILLVEDEPALMKMTKMLLERLNYHVLAASLPGEALKIAQAHKSRIKLMLTDVVMPEIDGHELAIQVKEISPTIEILFMSGYSATLINNQQLPEASYNFIQKPFSMEKMAQSLHQILSRQADKSV